MLTDHVQTKREIREILTSGGVRPKKALGQHFLIDGNLMRRLVECAELTPSDRVLEVGGGTGALTDLLAPRVRQLYCVELDRQLFAILEARFRESPHVVLIPGDVLQGKHRLSAEVVRALQEAEDDRGMKLVANLPYQVATPLVMNLLVEYPQVRRLVFTVQTEVAERFTAEPGCKAYGPLSILSQTLCSIRTIARIPPEAFWPSPAVHSTMLRMDVGASPFANRNELRAFMAFVRAVFDHRRKTLRSALGYVVDKAAQARAKETIDVTRRPEALTIGEWISLFRAI